MANPATSEGQSQAPTLNAARHLSQTRDVAKEQY
jgi:hypothetical protein